MPIGTTDEHPWRTTEGRSVETRDLTPGTELVSIDGGRAVVASVLKTDRTEPTYNFEVEGFHTYFVGESQVWVHNSCLTLISNVTNRGALVPNIRLSMSPSAFVNNLGRAGFSSVPLRGGASHFSRVGSDLTYVMRNSNSFGVAVDVYHRGVNTVKYGFR